MANNTEQINNTTIVEAEEEGKVKPFLALFKIGVLLVFSIVLIDLIKVLIMLFKEATELERPSYGFGIFKN